MIKLIPLILAALISLQPLKAQNIVEIDPTIPVRLGWDYTLPDPNVTGFKIYVKGIDNGVVTWSLVGIRSILPTSTNLDLYIDIPAPYIGTYVVATYNNSFESDKSAELTLIEKPIIPITLLAPTNLRVIQISK